MTKKIKIGITGLPGAGKTHALRKVVEMLEAEGIKVGGMITDAILDKGKKVGFMV
ncbi:MAG: nucleoside-triphosphatase, partial [Thermoplasmatota archaeon]